MVTSEDGTVYAKTEGDRILLYYDKECLSLFRECVNNKTMERVLESKEVPFYFLDGTVEKYEVEWL